MIPAPPPVAAWDGVAGALAAPQVAVKMASLLLPPVAPRTTDPPWHVASWCRACEGRRAIAAPPSLLWMRQLAQQTSHQPHEKKHQCGRAKGPGKGTQPTCGRAPLVPPAPRAGGTLWVSPRIAWSFRAAPTLRIVPQREAPVLAGCARPVHRRRRPLAPWCRRILRALRACWTLVGDSNKLLAPGGG